MSTAQLKAEEIDQTNSDDHQTDSPPLSPPVLPKMCTYTALNSIKLPNGVQLGSETKQIFVYPYTSTNNITVLAKDSN